MLPGGVILLFCESASANVGEKVGSLVWCFKEMFIELGGGVEQQANQLTAQGQCKGGRTNGIQTICLGGMLGVFPHHYEGG